MSDAIDGFEAIVRQLRAANSMLAALMMSEGQKKQKEMIVLLKDSDLPAAEIARILGTTTNTVQVTISQSRRRGKKVTPKRLESSSDGE